MFAALLDALPDLPTIGETVPGFEASTWFGVGVPMGTPGGVIEKLNREINAGLADSNVKMRLADLLTTRMALTPAEYGRHVAAETERWAKVVKFAGLWPDHAIKRPRGSRAGQLVKEKTWQAWVRARGEARRAKERKPWRAERRSSPSGTRARARLPDRGLSAADSGAVRSKRCGTASFKVKI